MKNNKFTPRPYQQKMINHMIEHPRCALMVGMGMGKTSSCLEFLDMINYIENHKTLVIAPKRVAQSTWIDEVAKWGSFDNLKIAAAVGTPKQRLSALNSDANVITINYENIEWLVENYKFDFDVIIADESTKLKSFRTRGGGKRAKALAKVAFKAKRFVALTGTPAPNGLLDLYGQIWFLDKGERLGNSYNDFASHYFQKIQLGNLLVHKYEPYQWTEAAIHAKIKDICLSLEAEDYFELGDTIVTNIDIKLPSAIRQQYNELQAEMFTALAGGEEIEALNAASLSVKCQQLASGAIYTDDDRNWTELHDEKLQALESIVNESGGAPILVAYHFKHDKERILAKFPYARELDSNPETLKDWNAGKIPMLLAHPASAGHGLNLQDGGNILVFFSHTWNLEEFQQICERIGATRQKQSGYDRPVFHYNIIAKDTVDEVIISSRISKQSTQQALMEAMKRWEANKNG